MELSNLGLTSMLNVDMAIGCFVGLLISGSFLWIAKRGEKRTRQDLKNKYAHLSLDERIAHVQLELLLSRGSLAEKRFIFVLVVLVVFSCGFITGAMTR